MAWCTETTAKCAGYDLVNRNRTRNIGLLFRRGWWTEPANSKPGKLQRDYYCPICAGFETFCRARNLQLQRQWMQQDEATAHTVGESLACLQQHFGDRLISRGPEFPFPSHSPDLTTPNAYIWGMLKESVFRSDDPPGNVPKLQEKIQSFFVSLQQPVFVSMSNNLKDCYEQCARYGLY